MDVTWWRRVVKCNVCFLLATNAALTCNRYWGDLLYYLHIGAVGDSSSCWFHVNTWAKPLRSENIQADTQMTRSSQHWSLCRSRCHFEKAEGPGSSAAGRLERQWPRLVEKTGNKPTMWQMFPFPVALSKHWNILLGCDSSFSLFMYSVIAIEQWH